MIELGLLGYFGIAFLTMWLDLTGRAKRPQTFFALGTISLMPLLVAVLFR